MKNQNCSKLPEMAKILTKNIVEQNSSSKLTKIQQTLIFTRDWGTKIAIFLVTTPPLSKIMWDKINLGLT